MKALQNQTYLIGFIVSNIMAICLLWAAIKKPRLARLLFVLLFSWACITNYIISHKMPEKYLEYGSMAVLGYRGFINGWFKAHITELVTFISICQGLIAIAMTLKGFWVQLACLSIIFFLICIAPLGIGAAFPFSVIASFAAGFILYKDDLDFLWKFKIKKSQIPARL